MKEMLQDQTPALIIEINPETLAMFSLKPVDICDYLNRLNFEGYKILETGELDDLKQSEIDQTMNALFIHHEKLNAYSGLFNK